jgi:hypothetical protein
MNMQQAKTMMQAGDNPTPRGALETGANRGKGRALALQQPELG